MDFKSNTSAQRFNLIKIRIDEGDYDIDKKDFLTTIDNFDIKLYSDLIQGKSQFDIFQREPIKIKDNISSTINSITNQNTVRFKESNHIYKILLKEKETISNYLFQSSVAIDPLFLKGGYKKKLTKMHKNTNFQKNGIHFEQLFNSNDISNKRKVNITTKVVPMKQENLGIFEKYETEDNPIIPKKNEITNKSNTNYKPAYTSTLNIFNSKFAKRESQPIDFNVNDLNISKEFNKLNDSVFSNRSKIIQKNKHNRPDFVEKLFDAYDYSDLDPWNKIQNHTKNKNLCLSVINDIYFKITY